MNVQHFCLVILLSFFPFFTFAQDDTQGEKEKATLTGAVSDSLDQDVLPHVLIKWVKDGKVRRFAHSDENGNFRFTGLPTGLLDFEVSYFGYEDIRFSHYLRPGDNEHNIALPQDPFTMSPIELTGIRPADFQKMTGTATRISPKKVEMLSPIGTQEALEFVPGVSGFSDDGIGNSRINIGIRGLNPRRSSRTLVLEDGIPIQPALYVYSNMYYNPPMERISEVEVIKGASAIQYGPHTMGGVVNYITNRPRKEFGGRFNMIYGSNGYISALAEVGGFGNDKVRPEIQLLYKAGDGYRDNNHFDQLNGTFKLMLLPNPDRKIYINLNANYEFSDATYTGLTEHSFRTNPTFNPKEFDLNHRHKHTILIIIIIALLHNQIILLIIVAIEGTLNPSVHVILHV
ncbi:MAG: TonB-dependent receptor plug domain-containing protein, partial [Bacteroidota bacterium]